MLAALDRDDHLRETAIKLDAARRQLEHSIVFDEHELDVFVLALLEDSCRAIEIVVAA